MRRYMVESGGVVLPMYVMVYGINLHDMISAAYYSEPRTVDLE